MEEVQFQLQQQFLEGADIEEHDLYTQHEQGGNRTHGVEDDDEGENHSRNHQVGTASEHSGINSKYYVGDE